MKSFLLFLCGILLTGNLWAQIPQNAAVDSLFSDWNRTDVPGCALGIIQEGEVIYAKGYGMADLEHHLPITPSSVFYLGSVSKQFVTFCILLLEEQGKLDLDDEIQQYLPDFPEYQAPLTIRHFIHHTSGVRDYLTLMSLKGRSYLDHIEEEEVYRLIKRQEALNFTPGEKYLYSNSCYFMLSMIVEEASGQTLREFAEEHIFGPLGMDNTLFYDDNTDLIENRVFSYQKTEQGFDNLILRFDLVGSGGVYSNIEDLLLWDQNFYDNKLGKGGPAIIEKMHEEGRLNNGESSGYAFALVNDTYKGLRTVSHSGSLAGYRSQLLRFPDQAFSVAILANRSDANPTGKAYQVADIFLKDQFVEEENPAEQTAATPNTSAAKPLPPKRLSGAYGFRPGYQVNISVEGDSLRVEHSWNNNSYAIARKAGNTFQNPDEPNVYFTFSEVKDGATQMLTVLDNGQKTVCQRKEMVEPATVNLEAYAGNYYCKELDVSYRFFIEDGVLKGTLRNEEPVPLTIEAKDQFIGKGLLCRFYRTEGKVAGFELDAGRVQNLGFVRE